MRDRLYISIELTFRNSFQLCRKRQEERKWRFLSGTINLCTRLMNSGGEVERIMHFTNIYHTPKTWSGRLYGQKRHLQQNLQLVVSQGPSSLCPFFLSTRHCSHWCRPSPLAPMHPSPVVGITSRGSKREATQRGHWSRSKHTPNLLLFNMVSLGFLLNGARELGPVRCTKKGAFLWFSTGWVLCNKGINLLSPRA